MGLALGWAGLGNGLFCLGASAVGSGFETSLGRGVKWSGEEWTGCIKQQMIQDLKDEVDRPELVRQGGCDAMRCDTA